MLREVTKCEFSGMVWEVRPQRVIVPYAKGLASSLILFLSTAEHVEFCGNLRGPPRKAKYSSSTDSELVP